MKRVQGHLAFGIATLSLGMVTAWQALRLADANRVNTAISSATASAYDQSVPEAEFAHALALARRGEYEQALGIYKRVIGEGRSDLRKTALYDLGNLNVREALRNGLENAGESMPLIELAKQSYRDLLRENPDDWDARYNLERALRLAPEAEDSIADESAPPVHREHERSTLTNARIDLP